MVTVCCNDNMSKVETRRARLRMLIAEYGLSELAEKTGKPASQLNDMAAGRKSFGEKIADQLTAKTGLPTGWFELWIGDETHEKFMSVAEDAAPYTANKLPFDDGYKPVTPLMSEIQSRDIPPHIEQAIISGATAQSAAHKSAHPVFGGYRTRPAVVESINATINALSDKGALDTEAIAAITALLHLIETKNN